ncbi:MAG: hypothetical protein IT270_19220, partial [Saprospiraceae bacterium]|nr:hypothetical protein [Saprospiraceae bacterium]
MPKQKTDDLLALIQSLTKAEKRHFHLFARRNAGADNRLFLKLFDVLDQRGDYDEAFVLKKIPDIKKSQIANLKAHLYRQLLTSLRLLGKNEDMALREMLDHARLLYNKGLYRQSLDILGKAKTRALDGAYTGIALEALDFEKLIESQYITRSLEGRAAELSHETSALSRRIAATGAFSNLSLQMYGLYLKNGFARNAEEYDHVRTYFQFHLPKTPYTELDFWGRVYHCQSYVWMHHLCQEFGPGYRYARRWVELYEQQPKLKNQYAPLYLKALHNVLNILFHSLDYPRICFYLDKLEHLPGEIDVGQDNNTEGLYHLYRFLHRIDLHYLEGTFAEGVNIIPELVKCIETDRYRWDDHRILVFYYRIACLYFGNQNYHGAVEYLNKIINQKTPDYRADIQCFARFLNLIAHFELGNMTLVEYQIKSV